MTKVEIIENALLETMKNHPNWITTVPAILYENATVVLPLRFSSSNGARENIKTTEPNDFIEYILVQAMKILGASIYDYNYDRNLSKLSPYERSLEVIKRYGNYYEIQNAKDIITNPKINAIAYYHENMNELHALINYVAAIRFNPDWYRDMGRRYLIDADGKGAEIRHQIDQKASSIKSTNEAINKIQSDRNKLQHVENIRYYPKTINQCLTDVLNGSQLKNRHNEYALDGTLFASQDIGKKRRNQEDSVIILTHPENKEFKLLAVSDGMGGQDKGEYASSETLKYISNWFNNLPVEYFNRPDLLQEEFNKAVQAVNYQICEYNRRQGITCGATFTGAIRTQYQTVLAHVGDSRAYTIKDGKIALQTQDESRVWPYLRTPDGRQYPAKPSELSNQEIDDLKFRRHSNEIYGFIGLEGLGRPQSSIINNADYDTLLIMSDGVSDLLSLDEIRIAAKTTPSNYLTRLLVEKALEKDAVRAAGEDYQNVGRISAGKDNATVAAYVGRRK